MIVESQLSRRDFSIVGTIRWEHFGENRHAGRKTGTWRDSDEEFLVRRVRWAMAAASTAGHLWLHGPLGYTGGLARPSAETRSAAN